MVSWCGRQDCGGLLARWVIRWASGRVGVVPAWPECFLELLAAARAHESGRVQSPPLPDSVVQSSPTPRYRAEVQLFESLSYLRHEAATDGQFGFFDVDSHATALLDNFRRVIQVDDM